MIIEYVIVPLAVILFILFITLYGMFNSMYNIKSKINDIDIGQIYIIKGSDPFNEKDTYEIIDIKYDKLGNKWIKYKYHRYECTCLAEAFFNKDMIRIH